MSSPAETVLTVLGAVAVGDVERARPYVADDFVWHIPGDSAIGGDAAGLDAWAAKLDRLVGAGLRPQVLAVLEGPDHVAVVQRNVASAGGRSLDVRVVNLFTLAGGKVQRMDTFPGDQHAVESFWNEVFVEREPG